jgi:superfamily II DNA or RNA helicase
MAKQTNLQVNTYKPNYDSFIDLPIEHFFVPSLEQSIEYNRAVGYFSSAIMTVLSEAFTNFAERGGKMKLICSPILTAGDAITFEEISKSKLLDTLNNTLDQIDADGLMQPTLNLMAGLMKSGCLSVKFAIPYDPGAGIFHQKIGIFKDDLGEEVAFSGSNNESLSGWMEMKNSESFSVYTSWRDLNDGERVADIDRRFKKMWSNQYRGFDVLDFSQSLNFIERRSQEDVDLLKLKTDVKEWYTEVIREKRGLSDDWLRRYQREVVNNWKENDHQGVVSFATGAGKTITAIGAIKEWRDELDKRSVIILVPSIRLQKQWLKEMRSFPWLKDVDFLLVGGDAKSETWMKGLKDITSSRRHPDDGIVIAVIQSAREQSFYERVSWGGHVLVVADEMHKLGAPSYRDLLENITAGGLLGLSATPERYNEEENEILRNLFGEELKPIVDIAYAQELGVLVQYRYRFETLMLTDDELEKYQDFTKRIGMATSGAKTNLEDASRLQILLTQRANILKNASTKVGIAAKIIRREFKEGNSWLVFCNDQDQLNSLKDLIKDLNPFDIHVGMEGDDDETIKLFEAKGGILLSIHMFDEGVDIPSIDNCIILASSQSKREFIQRRGRVLRVNKKATKGLAEIWDLIVVDSDGMAFVDSEADRAMEFARLALNRSIAGDLEKITPNDYVIPSNGKGN